jgi:hypothetical protein
LEILAVAQATPVVSTLSGVEFRWEVPSIGIISSKAGQITAALAETKIYHLWMGTE